MSALRLLMSNKLLSEIAARLEKMGCPVCLSTRFAVVLRCDLSQGDSCVLVGECQRCSGKFDIQNCATIEEVCAQAERRRPPFWAVPSALAGGYGSSVDRCFGHGSQLVKRARFKARRGGGPRGTRIL